MYKRLIAFITLLLILTVYSPVYAELSQSQLKHLKQQATHGNVHAQTKLGNRAQLRGNYNQAYHWFKKLTEQQKQKFKAGGLNNIGLLYLRGSGSFAKNYQMAKHYFEQAIQNNYREAYNSLGVIYEHGGHGIKQDRQKAERYYKKAAKAGFPSAQFNLAGFYANQKQYKKAFHWYHKSAKQYYLSGMLQTGIYYFLGKGVSQDKIKSCMWLKLSLKVYPDFKKSQDLLNTKPIHYSIRRACNKAVKRYLKNHNVPRKSEFKARLELKS